MPAFNLRSWFLLSVLGLSLAGFVRGQEPAPPWKDLLESELVVVGQYKSHKNGTLSLQVVDVLRGKGYKAGDVLPVKLSQRIGFKFQILENVKGNVQHVDRFLVENDGWRSPRMYHIDEHDKRVQETLITHNAELPHVYFFAKDDPPLLEAPNQVQPDWRRGWKRILDGKPDLAFEILYAPESEMSRKAVALLFKTRDREAIDGLLEGMMRPESHGHPRCFQTREVAERALRALGDKDGDVYDPVLTALSGGPGGSYDNAFRLARILARADGKRALADFKKLLQPGSRISTDGVLVSLHHLESEEGLDLMFKWMHAGREQAYFSFEAMMFNRHPNGSGTQMVPRARLQELAVPRLKKALRERAFPQDVHNVAMFYANFRFLAEAPPSEYPGWRTGFPTSNLPRRDGFPNWQRLEYESGDDLEPLLRADLIEGRKRLKDRIDKAPKPGPDGPFELPVLEYLAYRHGDADTVKKFKEPPEPAVRFMEGQAARFHRLPLSQFLKEFEKTPKLSADYWPRMAALFPAHAGVYFRELEALLLSEEKPKREFAINQLKEKFFWDFDFDADDYPFVNKKKLEALRPLLDRLRQSSDLLAMRGILLEHFGVKLAGPSGRGWLPAVEAAVLRWNSVIHLNALCVLGMIEEDPEIMRFANDPLSLRQSELEGHLKQRRAEKKAPARTADQLEDLWKDLDNGDRGTSYVAMQALLEGRETTVAWLRKQFKDPGRDAVRDVRAIQVLEHMPCREARTLLEELAAGPEGSPLTHEAKGALQRLARFWRW
jgi:hypothetical protein